MVDQWKYIMLRLASKVAPLGFGAGGGGAIPLKFYHYLNSH